MIASVRGVVTSVAPDAAVVEVGGVGLLVQCTPATLAELRTGREASLATSLVVREDSLTLYGFATADERAVFEMLQTATGVGPRLAQAILAVHPPDAVRRAVATDDATAFTLVPGIGRKGAQRIVLEMKDRLGDPGPVSVAAPEQTVRGAVRDALQSLGYGLREADDAARAVPPDLDVSASLKYALQAMERAR